MYISICGQNRQGCYFQTSMIDLYCQFNSCSFILTKSAWNWDKYELQKLLLTSSKHSIHSNYFLQQPFQSIYDNVVYSITH